MHWILLILILPYLILLLRIYRNIPATKYSASDNVEWIFVSVIIACRNEEINLPKLLHDLSDQDYNKNYFEVIIVDDHSTDSTWLTASSYNRIQNLIVVRNDGFGKKQAIRCGIKASKSSLIITTDADCSMGSRWLRTIVSFYSENKPDMIICPVRLNVSPGFAGRFQELEFMALQGITAGTVATGNSTMCNGANLSFTRESYITNSDKLHDELTTGDDVFLLHSLKKNKNIKILWLESADAIILTSSCQSFIEFIRQRKKWISKSIYYDDCFTIILGIATFSAVLLQVFLVAGSCFDTRFLPVLSASFLLKSVTDYLILNNVTERYNRKSLLKWFPVSIIFYPVYVLMVIVLWLTGKKDSNSPFPKGI